MMLGHHIKAAPWALGARVIALWGLAAAGGCDGGALPLLKHDGASGNNDRGLIQGDAGVIIITGDGAVGRIDCTNKPDGKPCSDQPGLICLAGKCVTTRCGDNFVDTSQNEQCDDGNTEVSDGCNACHWGCMKAEDCDDKAPCNGIETCDLQTHRCASGTNPVQQTCPLGTGQGVCRGGICVETTCGDNAVGANEECDDGNTNSNDGCESNCKYSCKRDTDCNDANACNGVETCLVNTHTCADGPDVSCNDAKPCTSDKCDPASGCVFFAPDADSDGSPCDKDCNDKDPSIYPGAPELCDGKDNDCNNVPDDGKTYQARCYRDWDGDGFAAVNAEMLEACSCPTGYTLKDPSVAGQTDCDDSNPDRFPGQKPQSAPYCDYLYTAQLSSTTIIGKCIYGWDYDCNGIVEKAYPSTFSDCSGIKLCAPGSGWGEAQVPECGIEAKYVSCSWSATTLYLTACEAVSGIRKQECR